MLYKIIAQSIATMNSLPNRELFDTVKAQIIQEYPLSPCYVERLSIVCDTIFRLAANPDKLIDSSAVMKESGLTNWQFYSLMEIVPWERLQPLGLYEHYDVSKTFGHVEQAVNWLEINKPGEEMSWPLLVQTMKELGLEDTEWNTLANWSWRTNHYQGTNPEKLAYKERYVPILARIEMTRMKETILERIRSFLASKTIGELRALTKKDVQSFINMDPNQWSKFCYKHQIKFETEVALALKDKTRSLKLKISAQVLKLLVDIGMPGVTELTEAQISEKLGVEGPSWEELKNKGFNLEAVRTEAIDLLRKKEIQQARLPLLRDSLKRINAGEPRLARALSETIKNNFLTMFFSSFHLKFVDAINRCFDSPKSAKYKTKQLEADIRKLIDQYPADKEYFLEKMAPYFEKLTLFLPLIDAAEQLNEFAEDDEISDISGLADVYTAVNKVAVTFIDAFPKTTINSRMDEDTKALGLLIKKILAMEIEGQLDSMVRRIEDEMGIEIGATEDMDDNNDSSSANQTTEDDDDVVNELSEEVGVVEARLSKTPKTYKELAEQLGLLMERIETRISQVEETLRE